MTAAPKLKLENVSTLGAAEQMKQIRVEFREELQRKISELGLAQNISDLEVKGYTVIEKPAPMAFFQEMREALLGLYDERRASGRSGDLRGLFSESIQDVVGRGRVFEQAVLNPYLNTIMSYLLGDGHVINATTGVVMEEGCKALFIHSDNAYIPDPFPLAAQTATAVWFTEDTTVEKGATRVIPGSHRYARHPLPGEGEEDAIALECPAGSLAIWNGALWHGNCGRTVGGQRVTLHTAFCRLHIRPFADNTQVSQEALDRNPPFFKQLLGMGLPFGQEHETGANPELRAHAGRLWLRRL